MTSRVADDRHALRLRALQDLVVAHAERELEASGGQAPFAPVVALICAYEEEQNVGAVLAKVPPSACGLAVTPLVVVDGGEDRTAEVARAAGAVTLALPVNLGHGVALRAGYRLCLRRGAQYVVTLDADGQNDPGELPALLEPLVAGDADFVLASRRLGLDTTADPLRRAGVVVFAWLLSRLNGVRLTDTSNGFRALRASMLADLVDRLEQDQYQTAELLTTAVRRGWRVVERPTVWHERLSGVSKKGGNLRYGFRYCRVLVGTWWRERRGDP
ncbi:MAG TPA: glycosyltransferase family 2 protein [Acidimicrobiales bacterium]